MNPPGFSILGAAWPMRSLLYAKRVGAQQSVHVVMVVRQQGIDASPEIPQVRHAGQVPSPRVGDARRVVHRRHSPDAEQEVARLHYAERVVQ